MENKTRHDKENNRSLLLSCPSYIIPGTYKENIDFISACHPDIKNIELLFYFLDQDAYTLYAREKGSIIAYASSLSYTVHLPDNILTESFDSKLFFKLLDDTAPFVFQYIVHSPENQSCKNLELFTDFFLLLEKNYGKRFLIENLINRPYGFIDSYLSDAPICCDIGHLKMNNENTEDFILHYGSRIREFHIHGIKDGKDHQGFSDKDKWITDLIPTIKKYPSILNIEVFSHDDLTSCVQTINKY